MTLRLALDQNFPPGLLKSLQAYTPNAELKTLHQIDPRLSDLDDRPLILVLDSWGWDGFVSNNYKMTNQAHEVSAIIHTKCVAIFTQALGDDPIRATGAVLLQLPRIEHRLKKNQDNVLMLNHRYRTPTSGWDYLKAIEGKTGVSANDLWTQHRPTVDEVAELQEEYASGPDAH